MTGIVGIEELGRRIRKLRIERRMTLKQVEQAAALSATHVSEIERGRTSPTIGALVRIARALQKDTSYYPVAYDFDWSGAVNTRYAVPAEQLPIRRVTDRIMRGYCTQPENYVKAIAVFKEKKDAIYGLYHDSVASLMKPDVVAKTLKYFDEFYEVINDPRLYTRFIIKACLEHQA